MTDSRMALVLALGLGLATCPLAVAEDTAKGEKGPEEMPVYGQTVVVTATRTESTIADSPVSITVVGPETIETTPADNYADLLRGVPGLNVVQFSARDINFASRGATSSLSTGQLALVDGRSVYQDFFGFVAWDFLPMSFDEVQQIEVLGAPGSAVWGANARTGVINVITKSPRESQGGDVMFGYGERDTYQLGGRWAKAFDEWSYKLSASYFEQEAWDRPTTLPSGAPMPPGFNFVNEGTEQPKFDVRVDHDPEPGTQWSFSGGGGFTSGLIHTGLGPFSVDNDTGVVYGKAGYRKDALDVAVFVNYLDGDAVNVLNGLDFVFENTTLNGEASYRQNWGEKQVLVFGGSARGNFFDLSIAPLDDKRTELGAYIEDQIHLSDVWHLNLGGRLDWFDTIGATFSPRASVVMKPAPEHSIRFAYNRAYRAPSLVNNYLSTEITQGILLPPPVNQPYFFPTAAVGNPDLDEELVDAIEIGYTVDVAERATLSFAWYRNWTDDLIDFFVSEIYSAADPPPGWPLPPAFVPPLPKSFSYRNLGKSVDMGFEIGAQVALREGLHLNGSYTWQDEPTLEIDGEEVPPELGLNIPPRHMFAANLTANHGRWYGSFGVTFTDEAFWQDVLDVRFHGTTDSYTLLNGALGYRLWEHLTLAVNGTNLADEDAQQHAFGDIIGRKVTGEVRAKF